MLEGASESVGEASHARYKAEQRDECNTGSEGGNIVKRGFGALIGWFYEGDQWAPVEGVVSVSLTSGSRGHPGS